MPIPTLSGRRIVVIGGSSGIGYAVAEGAVAEGARVVIGSRDGARVEAAAGRLGEAASGLAVDAGDETSVAAFFQNVGAFDHLVFTAGDWDRPAIGSIENFDFAAAAEGTKVRFWGAIRAVKHAKPHLAETGSVTLTDGLLAHRPSKGAMMSTAFAGAIEHLARGLAVELAPLRVNAVCPGLILTEAIAKWPKAMLDGYTSGQPIPRAGDPAEVAQAYLYLMRAGYTTGQVVIVDGGRILT